MEFDPSRKECETLPLSLGHFFRDRLIEASTIRVSTDTVIGKHFDRMGHSLRELLETVDTLKARGIHLISLRGASRHLLGR